MSLLIELRKTKGWESAMVPAFGANTGINVNNEYNSRKGKTIVHVAVCMKGIGSPNIHYNTCLFYMYNSIEVYYHYYIIHVCN